MSGFTPRASALPRLVILVPPVLPPRLGRPPVVAGLGGRPAERYEPGNAGQQASSSRVGRPHRPPPRRTARCIWDPPKTVLCLPTGRAGVRSAGRPSSRQRRPLPRTVVPASVPDGHADPRPPESVRLRRRDRHWTARQQDIAGARRRERRASPSAIWRSWATSAAPIRSASSASSWARRPSATSMLCRPASVGTTTLALRLVSSSRSSTRLISIGSCTSLCTDRWGCPGADRARSGGRVRALGRCRGAPARSARCGGGDRRRGPARACGARP
jgi:hypothetical protein